MDSGLEKIHSFLNVCSFETKGFFNYEKLSEKFNIIMRGHMCHCNSSVDVCLGGCRVCSLALAKN